MEELAWGNVLIFDASPFLAASHTGSSPNISCFEGRGLAMHTMIFAEKLFVDRLR